MAKPNYKSMSLKELHSHRKELERAISTAENAQKRDARKKLEAQAKVMGFSIKDLFAGSTLAPASRASKPRRATRPSTVTYVNPADRSQTWSGRGRRPAWVVAALASGRTLDDLK